MNGLTSIIKGCKYYHNGLKLDSRFIVLNSNYSFKLNLKSLLIMAATFLFINQSLVAQNTDVHKPNIIVIETDDQTYTAIHALGNDEIHTPNMDRLVKMGTSFSNAYNMGAWNGAVCIASRAMLISGRSVWDAKEENETWSSGIDIDKTWGKLMASGGYDTYVTGKWHIKADPKEVFQIAKNIKPGMPKHQWNSKNINAEAIDNGSIKLDDIMPLGYNRPKSVADTTWRSYDNTLGGYWEGGKHWNEILKDDALEFISTASKKENPFFIYIASNAPHDPRQAPKKYWDMYPLDKISLPKSWLPEYPYKNAIKNGPSLRDEALAPFPRTELAIKTHIREYYASITYLDEKIGQILDALEQSGKMENTYIFFTSDHGLAVGKHGLLGKQSLFEHSVKPPLIVIGPNIPKNKKIEAPVYLQDIMASTLDLGNIKKPDHVFFHSLIPLALNQQKNSSYPAIYGSYLNVARSIRKGDFKLILYPAINKALLFNLKNDPEEMHSLADQTSYKGKVKSLFKDFIGLQKTMKDPLDLSSWYYSL